MQFDMSRPDVVRAVNQRWLIKFWTQHLADCRVPRWQAVEAERLSSMQQNLSFLDVVPGADGGMRFLIRFHGEMIRHAYGSPDGRGRYLDEILTPGVCPTGITPYEKAVRDALPSTRSSTSQIGRAGWSMPSGCCCPSRAMARQSTASWPRSSSSAKKAPSTATPS